MNNNQTNPNQTTQSKNESNTVEAESFKAIEPVADKLSDFGLVDDLYLSLNYHYIKIPKKGFIARYKKQKVPLDIDLACALYDIEGNLVDLVWFKKLRDDSESIIHHGDEMHGYRSKDERIIHRQAKKQHKEDPIEAHPEQHIRELHELSPIDLETIHIQLAKLPKNIHQVALLATSYQDSPMYQVPIGTIELEDVEGNSALRVDLTYLPKDCTSLWLCSLLRTQEYFFVDEVEYQNWRFITQQKPLKHACIESLVQQTKV